MTETGWQAIGRIARLRRERLGLKQEELAAYGGPAVSTVGKFERAAQERFPLRTQHQMENALGWSRTIVEQVVKSIDEGRLEVEDWEYDLVEEDVPDLSRPGVAPHSTGDLDLDDFNMKALTLKAVLTLVPPENRDEATNKAVSAMLRFVPEDDSVGQAGLSAVPDRTESSVPLAADEDSQPIERGQGHDENA